MGRPKLTIPQQINDMKDSGIDFNIVSEAEASRFLEYNNYYFKLKAYEKNYQKYKDSDKAGKYINLEFAYLKDLSTIDSELRKIILTMSIDLEHFLKVKMLADFNKVDEDGYEIMHQLFETHPNYPEDIENKVNTSTCHSLIKKHKTDWAIWNVIEVMSFGQFIELYCLFYSRNHFKGTHEELLLPVKMIRNAAAHNNCLINCLRPPYSRTINPSYELKHIISQKTGINKNTVEKRLQHPTIHDFLSLLYLYCEIVPDPTRSKGLEKVKYLFGSRMQRNTSYYSKNQNITNYYTFVYKVINYL